MLDASMWMVWMALAAGLAGYAAAWRRSGAVWRRRLEWGLTWGAWLAVGAVSLASVWTHEPWRDELHTWLVTRDLTPGQIWHEMRWEGHVMLWQLVLHPFARWGAPVWTLGAVSWAINWAALWFFAKKAPFGAAEKTAAMAAVPFLYLNPVVSRCYVLVPPLLFGLAALWEGRDRHPLVFGGLVALLANTHSYLWGTAGLMALVFAWENVLRRADGKDWRTCGWQWAGLGVMAAGILVAVAQVLPTLWSPSRGWGWHYGWKTDLTTFFGMAPTWWLKAAALAGAAWAGWAAWKRDRGVFWVYAGSWAYMVGFSVFLYSANVANRAVLWFVLFLFALWALGDKADAKWRMAAMLAAGLALFRPDWTAADWREVFDPMPVACRWITERYGADAEVWVNGDDHPSSVAAAYLNHMRDWRTGKKTGRLCLASSGVTGTWPFAVYRAEFFRRHPEKDSFLVMVTPSDYNGWEDADYTRPGAEIEGVWTQAVWPHAVGVALVRVWRWGEEWGPSGIVRYQAGDRAGAEAAWKRAVEEEEGAWEAMNNLAWVALEEGRVAEARKWIDRAMEHEAARESEGAKDTEERIRKAEEGVLPKAKRSGG